jgi:hypothetical protein
MLNAGHRSADARIVGDVAGVVLRNVEIGADEDALAGEWKIGELEDGHIEPSDDSAPLIVAPAGFLALT